MNEVLARWNTLTPAQAAELILPCCGSRLWAGEMAARRPLLSAEALYGTADLVWGSVPREAWLEAFGSHPRIGEKHAEAGAQSLAWSAGEQSAAMSETSGDEEDVRSALVAALANGNRAYEERFGRVFIICASGRSAKEMLEELKVRLDNDAEAEMLEAAEQQRRITQLRLRKWLEGV